MLKLGHRNPLSATVRGLMDARKGRGAPVVLADSDRLDGKTCLVTGASSGLGKATAIQLAARGARVVMACRSGIPRAGNEVRAASGSDEVHMLRVDLADVASIHEMCDELRDRDLALDVLVCNAGIMPRRARRAPSGFEVMFAVNYLANVVLIDRLLADGRLRTGGDAPPRIVIVSSEAHRSAAPLDFDRLGAFVDYGVRNGMAQYAHTKLLLCTFATELARRLDGEIAVHSLCPGPVATNIAREAPAWLAPLLGAVMKRLFASPEEAAVPVVYLACAAAIAGQTGRYLHTRYQVEPSEAARDPDNGARLWAANEGLRARAEAACS